MKDEPVALKKIYGPGRKTRIFFSGPFEYLIAMRQYYLSALLRLTETFHEHPIKVGISGQMKDWHIMTTQLKSYSNSAFASDVSSFDSNIHKTFIENTKLVFEEIYKQCGLNPESYEEEKLIRATLHKGIEGAHILGMGNVYKLCQAQVSGNPGTAYENSMIMWCLFAMCFIAIARKVDRTKANYAAFKENVMLAVYGDDNICTVKEGAKWFNFNSFKEQAEEFGFLITDAAKTGGECPDFNTLEELEFLKRGFLTVQGWHMGPLMKASIGKMISWCRADQGSYKISAQHIPTMGGEWPLCQNTAIMRINITNAYANLALHGKEEYYRLAKIIDDSIAKSGRTELHMPIPTWADACLLSGYTVKE